MKSISEIFSDKYVNQSAETNIIIYLLGRLSYPLSCVFVKHKISPNQITTTSILLSVFASIALAYCEGWGLFVFFWTLSLLLDFCDGMVARMANQVRQSVFRYDHISDLFKIFSIILGVSARYDSTYLWVTSMLFVFFFMYYSLMNHELSWAERLSKIEITKHDNNNLSHIRSSSKLVNNFKRLLEEKNILSVFLNIYAVLFTINGHTLLLFLLFPLGHDVVVSVLLYLSVLSVIGVYINVIGLTKIVKI